MRPVHDAIADHVLGAVGLKIQNDLDAAEDQPHGKQQQEKRERPTGKARDRNARSGIMVRIERR